MANISQIKKEEIRRVVNRLNLGTNRDEVGTLLIDMYDRIVELEAKVEQLLEDGPE